MFSYYTNLKIFNSIEVVNRQLWIADGDSQLQVVKKLKKITQQVTGLLLCYAAILHIQK